MTGRSTELHLSIEVDSDPIVGSVAESTGEPRPFCGWMDLVAAIEAVRLGADRAPGAALQTQDRAPGAALDAELGGARGGSRRRRQAPGAILG